MVIETTVGWPYDLSQKFCGDLRRIPKNLKSEKYNIEFQIFGAWNFLASAIRGRAYPSWQFMREISRAFLGKVFGRVFRGSFADICGDLRRFGPMFEINAYVLRIVRRDLRRISKNHKSTHKQHSRGHRPFFETLRKSPRKTCKTYVMSGSNKTLPPCKWLTAHRVFFD